MPDDPAKKASGGILALIGLSPAALLVVAGATLVVWWYYAAAGARLNTTETAAVVLGLAVLLATGLALWRIMRRMLGRKAAVGEAPK